MTTKKKYKAMRNGKEAGYSLNTDCFPFNLEGVELDINKRWESGEAHDPRSYEIIKAVAELDFCFANDSFCLKYGGDGDNGEALAYLLDIYFEAKDKTADD